MKGTWHHNFMAGCGSLLWANTCSLWSELSLDQGQGVYSGWSDVVVSSQLRLCHTCIIDIMLRRNGSLLADNIFRFLFYIDCCILIEMSLKFVLKGRINNETAWVQIMAFCRANDKPRPIRTNDGKVYWQICVADDAKLWCSFDTDLNP